MVLECGGFRSRSRRWQPPAPADPILIFVRHDFPMATEQVMVGREGGGTNARDLLVEWERRCRINLDAHNWAERRFTRLNVTYGLVSLASLVALGVAAGTFDL